MEEKSGGAAQALALREDTLAQIAAGLAHDVKNPLALVSANIDLLEKQDGRFEASYRAMRREIGRVNDMLLDFLLLTRPAGARREAVSPRALAADLIDARQSANGKPAAFALRCSAEEEISADKNGLSRALGNLIKNAAEAVGEKENGLVEIEIEKRGGEIAFRVRDNGKGLTEEEAGQAGLPYFTTKTNGTGLGLASVRAFAAANGGAFTLAPNEGEGCTATLTLPVP